MEQGWEGSCPAPHTSSSPTGWTVCQKRSVLKGAKLVLTNPQGLKHRARCRGKPEAGSFGASGVCDFPGCSLSPPGVRGRGDGTRGQVPGEAPPPASWTPNEWLPLPSPRRFPNLSLSFPHPFPHSSPFGKFYSPLGLHFSTGWKCQGPDGVTRKWDGER